MPWTTNKCLWNPQSLEDLDGHPPETWGWPILALRDARGHWAKNQELRKKNGEKWTRYQEMVLVPASSQIVSLRIIKIMHTLLPRFLSEKLQLNWDVSFNSNDFYFGEAIPFRVRFEHSFSVFHSSGVIPYWATPAEIETCLLRAISTECDVSSNSGAF